MRFIRDIINEKRSHSSPEAPEEDHDRFAAEPALENEPADWAMEGEPQAEPRQSLDQGQIDESVLRNIFARQDAVEDAVEDDLSQQQDTAASEEVEPKLDPVPYEDMQGFDFASDSEASQSENFALDQNPAEEPDWSKAHQQFQARADDPSDMPMPERAEADPLPPADAPSAPDPISHDARGEPHATAAPVGVPQPAAGRSVGRSGRVKTRVLGFGQPEAAKLDVFSAKAEHKPQTPSTHPVGWLVVVEGPGQGSAFTLHDGVASIGRGEDQTVSLAFGDNSISRENHAAIAYDDEQRSFFLGHGGKTNLVRLNGRPVLSTEELKSDDLIRIGETTMRFVALCGATFSWSEVQKNGAGYVAAE
ncbi:MAG: FHA domain-containing protein [Pseudomonadota bacterium]